MNEFPRLKRGIKWEETRAAEWNRLFQTVEDHARKLDKQGPVRVTNEVGYRRITVVITKIPTATDTTLTVRRVRYRASTPVQCDSETACHYEFSGQAFVAYPDFGYRADDYKDEAHTATTLDQRTPFVKAELGDGTWRLEKPAAAEASTTFVKVMFASAGNRWVMVQEVDAKIVETEIDGSPAIDLVIEPVGDPFEVVTWPGTEGSIYVPMMESVATRAPIAKIEKHGGVWFLRQLFPWDLKSPLLALPGTGCPQE